MLLNGCKKSIVDLLLFSVRYLYCDSYGWEVYMYSIFL